MNHQHILPLLAAAALTLGACSSNTDIATPTTPAPPTTTAPTSTTSEPADTNDPGAPKSDMIGNYTVIPKGQPAEWDTTMYDIEDKHITSTIVKNAECGLTTLPTDLFDEAMNDQGEITGPREVTANPGHTFCVITLATTNTGNTPATWYGRYGNALTADGKEYAPAPEDTDLNYDIELHAGEQKLNPGQTLDTTRVIQVPADVDVTHILFPEASLNWEPVYALAIK